MTPAQMAEKRDEWLAGAVAAAMSINTVKPEAAWEMNATALAHATLAQTYEMMRHNAEMEESTATPLTK